MHPLEAEIRRRIALGGPMPVQQYMALCLGHPEHGYYTTRDPLGRAGDFITSPEISQMFGELIGLWAAALWHAMGEPQSLRLVELGPGRGTMMLDALRAAQVVPGFRAAVDVHLVETSPAMKAKQVQTLRKLDVPVTWHEAFEEVPPGPIIVLANEFFDALPVRQAIKHFNGWYERMVLIDDAGHLAYGISNEQVPLFEHLLPEKLRDAPVATIFEWRPDNLVLEISRRLVREGGAGLVIDYGHTESAGGETLQAMGNHAFADPLTTPGEFDLTAHVDFQAFALSADSMGARVHGPVTQAQFLRSLGLENRAQALKNAAPQKAAEIEAAALRLTDESRTGMGLLFKVLGFGHPNLALPGFEG
jgi:NADH dehydrogenase [ubiquinone] 1 alpha subcomplex assembly factor 7